MQFTNENDKAYDFHSLTPESKHELKQSIVDYLKEKDLYHKSDDVLIDELIFTVEVIYTSKNDIRQNGIKVDITRSEEKEPFFQKNRAVDVYTQALKQLQTLFKLLALSPSERQKLKIEIDNDVDEFENEFEK